MTSCANKVFNKSVPNNYISHLKIRYYRTFKDRIERIGLPAPSNQIKVTFSIILPSTWYICDFFLFHIEIEGKDG